LKPLDPEDADAVAQYLRFKADREPGIPSRLVQGLLRKLHEVSESEGIDQAKVDDLLERVKAGELL
jgi:hypothetical protein